MSVVFSPWYIKKKLWNGVSARLFIFERHRFLIAPAAAVSFEHLCLVQEKICPIYIFVRGHLWIQVCKCDFFSLLILWGRANDHSETINRCNACVNVTSQLCAFAIVCMPVTLSVGPLSHAVALSHHSNHPATLNLYWVIYPRLEWVIHWTVTSARGIESHGSLPLATTGAHEIPCFLLAVISLFTGRFSK